jgi:hypothetical protein
MPPLEPFDMAVVGAGLSGLEDVVLSFQTLFFLPYGTANTAPDALESVFEGR